MIVPSDLAWAKRTGGRLSRTRTAAIVWDVLQLRRRLRRLKQRETSDVTATNIDLPDSSIVAAALAECRGTCHEAIASHCLRTFAWGCMIAAGRNLVIDRELFAVAALLHDIEIGRTEVRLATGCRCFACAGAIRAEAFAISHGCNQEWARRIGDAISLHLNPIVPLAQGVEAHILQAGAALDVIGVGLSQLPKTSRAAVLAAHPRDNFKAELTRSMELEVAHGCRTRAAFLMSRGFGQRIQHAPFD